MTMTTSTTTRAAILETAKDAKGRTYYRGKVYLLDGTVVVVRTSHEAVLYRTADLIDGWPVPFERIPLDGLRERQGEGVALDGNLLYLSSEGRSAGSLLSLRCDLSGNHPSPTS